MTIRENELGQLLRNLRGGKSQDKFQEELQKQLGEGDRIPEKYISLVETGARRRLASPFVRALAKLVGRSPEQIEESYRRPPQTESATILALEPIRIASGHTVWSAGLVAAALGGYLPDFKLATLANVATPADRRSPTAPDGHVPTRGPNGDAFLENGDPSPENAAWIPLGASVPQHPPEIAPGTSAAESDNVPLSASDALSWLEHGRVDIAAVPRSLIAGKMNLLRVGQLVDSATGCTLLCTEELGKRLLGNDGWEACTAMASAGLTRSMRPDSTTKELGDALAALLKKETTLSIAAEPNTLAQKFLEEACEEVKGVDALALQANIFARDLNRGTFRDVANMIARRSNGGKQKKVLGIITWEPLGTWLLNRSREKNGHARVAAVTLRQSPDPVRHCPRHLEFDLVVRNDPTMDSARHQMVLRKIPDLLYNVWRASGELARLEPGRDHPLVEPLARYYGVADPGDTSATARTLLEIVGPVRFDVAPAMESWHQFLAK